MKPETLLKWKEIGGNISGTLATLLRIPLMCRRVKPFPQVSRQELVILGNGPSLNDFLDNHFDFLKEKDTLAVNLFATTERFEQVRPTKYLIVAPEYWMEDVDDDYKKWSSDLFSSLAEKTRWKMDFFVPVQARKNPKWQKIIARNPNIRIVWFNTMPAEGFKKFRYSLYDARCGMPRPHNVIIPSLMNGILSGYKTLYLTGVDHDWLKSLQTGEDNVVYLVQEHFYYDPVTSKPNVMKKMGKVPRKMHEILEKWMLAFKGYHEIAEYARHKQVNIYNLTPHSLIDAFPKRNLSKTLSPKN